jgi:D-sedoheptulose 7-phosphate isomerase
METGDHMEQQSKETAAATINEQLLASANTKLALAQDHVQAIGRMADAFVASLRIGGKIILFGNGGSAADAQHIACELVGHFKITRPALRALSLTTDTSLLTSIGNDFDFDHIFARQIESLARPEDVLVGISTSGRSGNVLNGLLEGARIGSTTVCLAGMDGGPCAEAADVSIIVPSDDVPRIQEAHITVGHIVCHLVEEEIFADRIE